MLRDRADPIIALSRIAFRLLRRAALVASTYTIRPSVCLSLLRVRTYVRVVASARGSTSRGLAVSRRPPPPQLLQL